MGTSRRAVSRVLSGLLLGAVLAGCSDGAGPDIDSRGFVSVSAGAQHTCAVARTGTAYCWGSDGAAQLGDEAGGNRTTPVQVQSAATFIAVSAGAYHTCALDNQGSVHCWGNNTYGQLGVGATITLTTPVIIAGLSRVVALSSGRLHTCALTSSGEAYCWGAGGQGQLGTGRTAGELSPARVAGSVRFAAIGAGAFHTCALALDGRAYCWGQNNLGQLGTGVLDNSSEPRAVQGGRAYAAIAAGGEHSCAVEARTGAGFCWGSAVFGELGTTLVVSGFPGSTVPSGVFGGTAFTSISAGEGFTCAVATRGTGLCWGRGLEGQLGNGKIRNWATPQFVSDGQIAATPLRFAQVSATGMTHACGLTDVGALYCWGRGDMGQLGNATTSFSSLAMRVATQ